jgi:hypothetical protein
MDNPELASLFKLVDQHVPVWAAGQVADRVKKGLVDATDKELSAGPSAFVLTLDPTDGANIDLGVVMANDKDAQTLEKFAKSQMDLFVLAAQAKNVGNVVDKVSITTHDKMLSLRGKFSVDDINRAFCVLDGKSNCSQDATP